MSTRFKRNAKQKAENRNIARIARKTMNANIETKHNHEFTGQLEIPYHHEALVSFHELTCTKQGVQESGRIGGSVGGIRINMKLLLRNADDATSVDASIRVLVVKSKLPLDVVDFNFMNPAGADGYATTLDTETIIVKYDKTHMLGAFNASSRSTSYSPFKSLDLNFNGIGKVEWENDIDVDASVNPWYLILYRCDNSGVSTGRASYVLNSRMFYKDA